MKNKGFNFALSRNPLYVGLLSEYLYYFVLPLYCAICASMITFFLSVKEVEKNKPLKAATAFTISLGKLKKMDPIYLGPILMK